jgi:hypothetical protein
MQSSQVVNTELETTKTGVQASQAEYVRLRALMELSVEFLNVFKGSTTLNISIADKVLTTINNLYFLICQWKEG